MENESITIEAIGAFSGNILRLLEQCDDEFLSLSKPDFQTVGQYRKAIWQAIRNIHIGDLWQGLIRTCIPEPSIPEDHWLGSIDCCHIQYPSLILNVYSGRGDEGKVVGKREIDEGTYVRDFFAPFEPGVQPISDLMEKFARVSHSYEVGAEIHPHVDAEICSIGFFPDKAITDLSSWLNKGTYVCDKNAISSLVEMLSSIPQLRPYAVSPTEFKRLYQDKLSISQEQSIRLWEKAKEQHKEWSQFVPSAEGVLHFAFHAALNTLQMISERLFSENPRKEPEAEQVRNELLAGLTKDSGHLEGRALSLVPIRVAPHIVERRGQRTIYRTIGHVAFYSTTPIPAQSLVSIAMAERAIFSSLRNREFCLMGDEVTNYVVDLSIQSLYAKRLAHSIKTPFVDMREFAARVRSSAERAEEALKSFTTGDFKKLKNRQKIEIYRAISVAEASFIQRIDRRKIDYNRQVKRDVFVYADPEDLQFILEVLIDNASTYAQTFVRVYSEVKEKEKQKYTYIIVENDGDKIQPDARETLFEPAIKITQEEVRHGKGFGVGLHLARRFAEDNQGYLSYDDSIQSQYNKFVLTLPARETGDVNSGTL